MMLLQLWIDQKRLVNLFFEQVSKTGIEAAMSFRIHFYHTTLKGVHLALTQRVVRTLSLEPIGLFLRVLPPRPSILLSGTDFLHEFTEEIFRQIRECFFESPKSLLVNVQVLIQLRQEKDVVLQLFFDATALGGVLCAEGMPLFYPLDQISEEKPVHDPLLVNLLLAANLEEMKEEELEIHWQVLLQTGLHDPE